jgi:hypothetical protein
MRAYGTTQGHSARMKSKLLPLHSNRQSRYCALLLVAGFIAATSAATAGILSAGVLPAISTTFAFDRNNTFGRRFTPDVDIEVSELGFFDPNSLPGGSGAGLAQSHDAGIFNVADQTLLASAAVPAGTNGILDGNFRYQTLADPVRLTAGTTYVMAGFALSASPDRAGAATN